MDGTTLDILNRTLEDARTSIAGVMMQFDQARASGSTDPIQARIAALRGQGEQAAALAEQDRLQAAADTALALARETAKATEERGAPHSAQARANGGALRQSGAAILFECRDACTANIVSSRKERVGICLRAGETTLAAREETITKFRKEIRRLFSTVSVNKRRLRRTHFMRKTAKQRREVKSPARRTPNAPLIARKTRLPGRQRSFLVHPQRDFREDLGSESPVEGV